VRVRAPVAEPFGCAARIHVMHGYGWLGPSSRLISVEPMPALATALPPIGGPTANGSSLSPGPSFCRSARESVRGFDAGSPPAFATTAPCEAEELIEIGIRPPFPVPGPLGSSAPAHKLNFSAR